MPAFASGGVAVFSLDATAGGALVDYSAFIESVSMPGKRTTMRLPRLGGNAVAKLSGPTDSQIQLTGWYYPTVVAALQLAVNETTPVTRSFVYGPQGSTTGNDKCTGEVYVTELQVDDEAESPGKWTATLEIDGNVTWGVYP